MAAAGTRSVVVWEWETDIPGVYVPYSVDASNFIEQERNARSSEVNLSGVDSFHAAWKVDLILHKQVALNGKEREVRRKVYSSSYPIFYNIVWEWKGDNGWEQFSVKIAEMIEDSYNDGAKEFDLAKTKLKIPNTINFSNMSQRNMNTGYVRNVRRRQLLHGYASTDNQPKSQQKSSRTTRAVVKKKPLHVPKRQSETESDESNGYCRNNKSYAKQNVHGIRNHKAQGKHSKQAQARQCSSGVKEESDSTASNSDHDGSEHTKDSAGSYDSEESEGAKAIQKDKNCVVVWEWETNTTGVFAPYQEKASNFLEKECKAGRNIANLAVIDEFHAALTVDLSKMKQKSRYYGRERQVRRTLYRKDSCIGKGVVWEYKSDLGWQQYLPDVSDLTEDCFNNGENQVDLERTPQKMPCKISFGTFVQVDKNNRGSVAVRRRVLSASYLSDAVRSSSSAKDAASGIIDHEFSSSRKPRQGKERKQFIKKKARQNRKLASTSAKTSASADKASSNDEKSENSEDSEKAVIKQLRKRPIKHQTLRIFCQSCDSVEEDAECSICLEKLAEHSSAFGEDNDHSVIELKKCHHKYHECCLEALYENGNKDGSLQCPVCKTIHGVKHGIQPPGTMTVTRMSRSVPGYEGQGSFQITYTISSGIQGPNHPNPGTRYSAPGFPRIAYLPDNRKGNEVLRLLQTAWDRKLIFTIATSVTTGAQNAVVWNEIHHKTEGFSNNSGHGYPDPNYLDNVLQELKSQGVS